MCRRRSGRSCSIRDTLARMPIITGIVPSPDRPGHVVILVDGVAFATVPEERAAGLAPGQGDRKSVV